MALPLLAAAMVCAVLFLLPGGRPRRFAVISDIHAGGLPRRRTRPRARRSRLMIASSICDRSSFNSARIFDTSIFYLLRPPPKRYSSRTGFVFLLYAFTLCLRSTILQVISYSIRNVRTRSGTFVQYVPGSTLTELGCYFVFYSKRNRTAAPLLSTRFLLEIPVAGPLVWIGAR